MNIHKGTYEPGDTLRYDGTNVKQPAFPGLYWYSGMGSGTFFRNDGTMLLNCSPQEAVAEARRLGLKMEYHDSMSLDRIVSVAG